MFVIKLAHVIRRLSIVNANAKNSIKNAMPYFHRGNTLILSIIPGDVNCVSPNLPIITNAVNAITTRRASRPDGDRTMSHNQPLNARVHAPIPNSQSSNPPGRP